MLRRTVTATALAAAALVLGLLAAEGFVRWWDGFPVLTPRLPAFSLAALRAALAPRSLVPSIGAWETPADVDPAWIDQPPRVIGRPPDPDLVAIRAALRHPHVPEYDLYNVWNARFVDEVACTEAGPLPFLPMPIQLFDPPEPSRHPPYRYRPGRTTPQGLAINAFGFRGADIPLDKPANTVRIAFSGASTTIGAPTYPYSYPECVIHWLNLWAARTGRAVRFDGVNAGRTGISSTDSRMILRYEVLPLEPDLLVYYEGANQFVFAASLTDAGRDASRLTRGLPPATWGRWIAWPRQYSALAQRLDRAVRIVSARGGREPAKPAYELRWPAAVDMANPDITQPDLPLALPTVLGDLDAIRTLLLAEGADMALASFMWLAADGLRLDPVRHGFIYEWLNDRCWPYRYADIRRLADFQNLVFARWAAAHDVLFVDLAGHYPPDPTLFLDAIHFNEVGIRLQAWVVFQGILPRVRAHLDAGTWPRADRQPLTRHPVVGPGRAYTVPCAR